MQITNSRRWLVAIVSCLINFCIGINYAWSVIASPLAQRINEANGTAGNVVMTAAGLAIVFSITNAIMPIPMVAAGAINDRKGPKWIVFVGGILFGIGLLLTGHMNSRSGMILTYSIMVGIGNSAVYTCTVNNTVKFFPDKKGLIGGLTSACYGLGSIIFPPVIQSMVDAHGITKTLDIFGIVILIVICAGAFLLKRNPITEENKIQETNEKNTLGKRDYRWNEIIKTPMFYLILLLLACGSTMGMLIISQASSIAQGIAGMTPSAAAVMVSLISACNTAARIVSGYVSDKIGRINVLTIALCAAAAGLVMLYFSGEGVKILFGIGICLVGVCFGSFLGVYPGFVADNFGIKNNSFNYGLVMIGNSIGALGGPAIMTGVFNMTGSYRSAFPVAVAIAVAGIVLTMICRIMGRKHRSL